MSVLDGPRREIRRILDGGTPQWVSPSDDGSELVLMDGRRVPESTVTYLPPCDPSKILCIHLNYDSRRVEFRAPALTTPTYFQKPTTALNSHRGVLYRPADCQLMNYEGEVAAVVGRPMRNVSREDVWDHLAGFAPSNDVGLHDFRETDAGSMLRVKGQDGNCPIGPGLVSGVDIRESTLRTFATRRRSWNSCPDFATPGLCALSCRALPASSARRCRRRPTGMRRRRTRRRCGRVDSGSRGYG